jgi:hypothetical protein
MVQACGTTAPTPEPVKDGAAGVVSVLADRGERARPGQHRARPQQQDRRGTVAYSAGLARIGDRGKGIDQGERVVNSARLGLPPSRDPDPGRMTARIAVIRAPRCGYAVFRGRLLSTAA